jgi:hypothetical protein
VLAGIASPEGEDAPIADTVKGGSLTIDIFQTNTSPPSANNTGSGTLVGSVNGTLFDDEFDTIKLTFATPSITIPNPGGGFPPNVVYTITPNPINNSNFNPGTSQPPISIAGTVEEAPLPATLWTGAVLLAGVAFVYARKKSPAAK